MTESATHPPPHLNPPPPVGGGQGGGDGVLVTQDLEKVFGESDAKVFALRKVNLTVKRGEFLTVMGPSGSGKTTLLTLMGGIDTPTGGKVLLEGDDLAAMNDDQLARVRRQRIGFVFQSFNLLPILTAEDNVALPLLLDNHSKTEALERARALLDRLGVAHRRLHYPSAMSGGEQQRVAICRALAAQPPIVLADEPTGNLDTANRTSLLRLLRHLVDDLGQTLVMVTHDVNMAPTTDRVVILRDGQIHTTMAKGEISLDRLITLLKPEES